MNVFFQPFVGRDYTTGGIFGKRIMVLGESHYCDEGCTDCGNVANHPECRTFTNGVVNDYLNEDKPRERWMSTFLKFERSLVGHETEWQERQRIWQSVLFYNYLQVAMGGPRKAGTEAEYRQAEEAFFSVLDQYRPQYYHRLGQPPVGTDAWRRTLAGRRCHLHRRLYGQYWQLCLERWRTCESDGGQPPVRRLLMGLLAQGNRDFLEKIIISCDNFWQ